MLEHEGDALRDLNADAELKAALQALQQAQAENRRRARLTRSAQAEIVASLAPPPENGGSAH